MMPLPALSLSTLVSQRNVFQPNAFQRNRQQRGALSLHLAQAACLLFLICATAVLASAQTFTTLTNFDWTNGANPYSSIVQGIDENFYGTTASGGAHSVGSVFRITPAGKLTTVYSFCAKANCPDGAYPEAGLVLASNGNLYGTTNQYGANGEVGGTIFLVTPGGKVTTLYSFCSQTNCADGAYPDAPLIQAKNGNLYGTTSGGGYGYGTIFEVTPSGKLTTLYSFCPTGLCADGLAPEAPLMQSTNGNLYGTTEQGGVESGAGTIFQITPSGKFTVLHTFDGNDGRFPLSGLVQAANGNFYGTTAAGGVNNDGTVFEMTPSGTLTTLHNFDYTDGQNPVGLIQLIQGSLYGSTSLGGASGVGTVFQITPSGILTTLHSFNGSDGTSPLGGLVQGTNGTLYGTTSQGGSSTFCQEGCGTVFSLSMGLKPFVEVLPNAGKVNAEVMILGNNLPNANAVTFNGTPAAFAFFDTSELIAIFAIVPQGATTGPVQVSTPTGSLTSKVPFDIQ